MNEVFEPSAFDNCQSYHIQKRLILWLCEVAWILCSKRLRLMMSEHPSFDKVTFISCFILSSKDLVISM